MGKLVLDLSRNNARPDFSKLAQVSKFKVTGPRSQPARSAQLDGVILKTTEGAGYNAAWDAGGWAAAARRAGLRVGFYHFARPSGSDAVAEARNFAAAIKRHGGVKRRDYRPALDMEATAMPHSKLYAWSRAFNQEIRNQGLPTPMFYTYPHFLATMNPPQPIGNGLWFANYTGRPGVFWNSFAPWKKVHLHQFESQGYVQTPLGYRYPSLASDGRYHLDLNWVLSHTAILAHPILGRL